MASETIKAFLAGLSTNPRAKELFDVQIDYGSFLPGEGRESEWHDGDPITCNEPGRHEGGGASGIWYTPYLTCRYCGGAIINDPRYPPHNCPAKNG